MQFKPSLMTHSALSSWPKCLSNMLSRRLHLRFKAVLFAFILLASIQVQPGTLASAEIIASQTTPDTHGFAKRSISLDVRQPDRWTNGIFKQNILLNLYYLRGNPVSAKPYWDEVVMPFHYSFELSAGEVFSYHEDVLSEYEGKVVKTTNSHFNYSEGFKSDGYLMGDGVCHLASLFYWAAKDAGLDAYAPSNHNFAQIPEIPAEYGVAIYYLPGNKNVNSLQNLYIKNNKQNMVVFEINYDGNNLEISVIEKE